MKINTEVYKLKNNIEVVLTDNGILAIITDKGNACQDLRRLKNRIAVREGILNVNPDGFSSPILKQTFPLLQEVLKEERSKFYGMRILCTNIKEEEYLLPILEEYGYTKDLGDEWDIERSRVIFVEDNIIKREYQSQYSTYKGIEHSLIEFLTEIK